MDIAAWSILVIFSIVGLLGIVIPLIPGVTLILVGVMVHKILLPNFLSWWTVGAVLLGVVASYLIDFVGSFVGAKWGGATKYGLYGLFLGGLIGLFFGFPGLILGPLIGVFAGELLVASRTPTEATRAGIGATLGLAISSVMKFLLALILIVWIALDLFFFV